jgi:hypothetical protein
MKIGEYYFSKFNKYVAQITKTGREIELQSIMGVKSTISAEYFNDNYIKCNSIYQYRDTIAERFKRGKVEYFADGIKVDIDDERIIFSIEDDNLKVDMTDEVKDALNLEYNITRFLLRDLFEVINTIADLFTED